MKSGTFKTAAKAERTQARKQRQQRYVFRLYVAGITPRSTQAIRSVRKFCEQHLSSRYDLEVVDIYREPILAKDEKIKVAPTLVRRLPLPVCRVVGDMSDIEPVLIGMDAQPVEE